MDADTKDACDVLAAAGNRLPVEAARPSSLVEATAVPCSDGQTTGWSKLIIPRLQDPTEPKPKASER